MTTFDLFKFKFLFELRVYLIQTLIGLNLSDLIDFKFIPNFMLRLFKRNPFILNIVILLGLL